MKGITYATAPPEYPPLYIYRKSEHRVEEGRTGGVPLGLSARGRYHEEETVLEPGDVVLLMTDGLPERLDEKEEWFGYERVQELFLSIANQTPYQICKAMEKGGNDWADGLEQNDDVSFMVIRIR